MPATVRDILLMIRAKEDVQRSLGAVSSSMRRAAAQADAASARSRAAAVRAAAQQARINGATAEQVSVLENNARAWDDHAKAIEKASSRTGELGKNMERVGQITTVAGIGLAAAGAIGVAALGKTVQAAQEWDRQVRLTWTQVDKKYKPSLQALGDIGIRVASKVAVPFNSVQSALYDIFSSMDVNLPQAESLLTSFSKAAVAGQVDIQEASRATIGLMNTFDVPIKDVNKVLNVQFELVKEGIGTYAEWAGKLGNVSPSARRAGQSMETMAAALATATRQGMTAARASTSVARAFDAMSNPKTEKNLQKLGIATRDARGEMLPMVDVLGKWKEQLDKLPAKDRVKEILDVMKGAGGTIEARRFLQNILLTKNGLSLFQQELKAFATDKDAFARGYNEMANSVQSKTVLLNNAWQTLKVTVGQALTPVFISLIGYLQKLLNWFNNLPAPVKDFIAKVALLAAGLSVVSGIVLIVVGAFVALAGAIAAAGTAILPVLGVMAAIGVVVTAVVAGIALLGGAFATAWSKSKPFRDLMHSIWQDISDVGSIAKTTAGQIWGDFSNTVGPAFRNVATVINTDLLPAAQDLEGWFRKNILPAIQNVATFTRTALMPAWTQLKDAINNEVVPALRELAGWWRANKDMIEPLGRALAILGLADIVVLVTQIASLIKAFAVWLSWMSRLAAGAMTLSGLMRGVMGNAVSFWVGAYHTLVGIINGIINWFRNLGSGAQAGMNAMQAVVSGGIARVRGVFSGAIGWLFSAGVNLIMGFVHGIGSAAGQAVSTALSVARSVVGAVTGALGIHSPSTVFKDIGVNVIRGLTQGVKDGSTLKQLQTAMFNISRDVTRSIEGADPKKTTHNQRAAMLHKWNGILASDTSKLNSLDSKRIALRTQLTAVQKSANEQLKARNELASKITDTLLKQTDLTSLDAHEQRSTGNMITGLQKRLKALQDFQANLRSLAQRGLDKQTVADLAQQGVDTAGTLVKNLAAGSNADLKQITDLQAQIRKVAGTTGQTVAGDLYNAGLAAAQGLAKGLLAQITSITKAMTNIANALVNQIKKDLGIHSPSRVMHVLGVNTAKGYISGYVQHMNRNMGALGIEAPGRVGFGSPNAGGFMGTNVTKNYNQTINVHTQEIDPRKTSAQLGWELMGKVG